MPSFHNTGLFVYAQPWLCMFILLVSFTSKLALVTVIERLGCQVIWLHWSSLCKRQTQLKRWGWFMQYLFTVQTKGKGLWWILISVWINEGCYRIRLSWFKRKRSCSNTWMTLVADRGADSVNLPSSCNSLGIAMINTTQIFFNGRWIVALNSEQNVKYKKARALSLKLIICEVFFGVDLGFWKGSESCFGTWVLMLFWSHCCETLGL